MSDLKEFKEQLQKMLYGETPAGCCISCKQPFSEKNVHTEAGWKETKLSGLCEDCWDKEFSDD